MSIMQTRKMKKQQAEDTIVDLIEKLVLGRFEDPDQRASAQRSINGATTDLSKRQKLLTLMEKDGTQTEKDARVLGDIGRLMKTFDPYGTGFSLAKDHLTPLVEHLREYVRVGEIEKKEHGEVMTPIWLVEDMLDKLPEHVWSDPSLKWLDPCNGCGVFPSVVVSRLMAGLQTEFPDQVERYRHIVENMIHVCDIQAKNCFLHMVAFDPKDLFDMNIYCGSFLDEEFDKIAKDVWGVEKFDVIIGNPPYQEQKPGHKKSNPIWHLFTQKSFSLMGACGFLCFVHPSGWRNAGGRWDKLQKEMLSKNFIYLEMHDVQGGIRTFGAATRYDWYVIQNSPAAHPTTIKCQDGQSIEWDLRGLDFIPSGRFEEIFSMMATPTEEKVDVIHSFSAYESRKPHVSKEKISNHVHPCIMNIGKGDKITKIYWSNTDKNGHFGLPKVVFGRFGSNVFIDEKGEYGMCQDGTAIVDDEETLSKVKKAMQSKRFVELMENCDVGGLGTIYNRRVIALFRKDFWKEFIDD